MTNTNTSTQLMDIAARISGMREILGYSIQKMAELTEITEELYNKLKADSFPCINEAQKILMQEKIEEVIFQRPQIDEDTLEELEEALFPRDIHAPPRGAQASQSAHIHPPYKMVHYSVITFTSK